LKFGSLSRLNWDTRSGKQCSGEQAVRSLDLRRAKGGSDEKIHGVVQAESHDAATRIFGKDHPHLQMPCAWIEIVEIMSLPGM
jgi:hypothetical protein